MADAPRANVDDVSAVFSAALRDMPGVRDAWVSTRDDGYDLWLLIEASDIAAERKFYASIGPLYETFPTADFMLHVLNPDMHERLTADSIVPPSAQRVRIPASA